MKARNLEKERIDLEHAITDRDLDFSATYMALCDLHAFVKRHPHLAALETVACLERVMYSPRHLSQKQALFLYKEAASALASIPAEDATGETIAASAIFALKNIVTQTSGIPRRAAAEAMGDLPVRVAARGPDDEPIEDPPVVAWKDLLSAARTDASGPVEYAGRSIVVRLREDERLVVKLACTEECFRSMSREAAWMDHLRGCSFPVRFDIPQPLRIQGSYLFKLADAPIHGIRGRRIHPECRGIAFICHKDYFTYLNEHDPNAPVNETEFKEAVHRNSILMGRCASLGIIHHAPIPLFHNRVQRQRRSDQGLYEWPRGGRLDRWLHSCRFPNFGPTGLRDLEHLIGLDGSNQKLYQHIGTHILSLLLVAGSYFRNKDKDLVGLDHRGNPVDARHLFDGALLQELATLILKGYYEGFTGGEYAGKPPFDLEALTLRMVEEMGVDRHMEEILRTPDQQQMTDEEFRAFLVERGFSETDEFQKGVVDIVIHTGPHLGGFNQRISLPEAIEFVASASALCVAGKFLKERYSSKLETFAAAS